MPGMHMAAVGPCTQEHTHPLCTPGIPNPALPVREYSTKEVLMPYNVYVLFTFLIVSEDLVTFPTPVIIIIVSKVCPEHDAA